MDIRLSTRTIQSCEYLVRDLSGLLGWVQEVRVTVGANERRCPRQRELRGKLQLGSPLLRRVINQRQGSQLSTNSFISNGLLGRTQIVAVGGVGLAVQ